MHTIHFNEATSYITSVTNVGDFNADGYSDLLIGLGTLDPYISAPFTRAYLYYGGSVFDTIPDLVFQGAPQQYIQCRTNNLVSGFGNKACPLGDYNGDGYNDFAIGSPFFCGGQVRTGRIYIYWGGPNPDTSADIIIEGQFPDDDLGNEMSHGDYNGDNLGDLFAMAFYEYGRSRLSIYFGSDSPDSISDWNYEPWDVVVYGPFFGGDVKNDGYDDFGWYQDDLQSHSAYTSVFFGADSILATPSDTSSTRYWPLSSLDISGDGISDLILANDSSSFLCLGNTMFDFEQDYEMHLMGYENIAALSFPSGSAVLICDAPNLHKLWFYNTGIPFDTIPCCTINYGRERSSTHISVRDIDSDGLSDLALLDSTKTYLHLYSLVETSIADDRTQFPKTQDILSAYPNPFNAQTTISYSLPKASLVTIDIYDLLGRKLETLVNSNQNAGSYSIIWDATERSSGIYFCRIKAGEISINRKMVLLK